MSVKGIPKSEKIWVTQTMSDGTVYYTTSKENDRSMYFLYRLENDTAVRIGKSRSPSELEQKYIQ